MIKSVILVLVLSTTGYATITGSNLAQPGSKDSISYEAGKLKYDAGAWQDALRIWMTAISDSAIVEPDPRLGIGFLQLVTEKELQHLYNSASLLYLWSLTTTELTPYASYIKFEIERIKPLIDEDRYQTWMDKLRAEDPTVLTDLRSFWIGMDPTPMQQPNERLLEHWQRIAYAKKHFNRNTSTVYGSDDRGTIYVRLGKPDRIKSGMLVAEETEIRNKLVDLNSLQPGARELGLETLLAQQQISAIRSMFQPTEYEIWIYERMDRKGTAAFIFGTPGDGGFYGLRRSVNEFIPRAAFRTAIVRPGDNNYNQVVAGNVLELGIYRDLASVDDYFAEVFVDAQRNWERLMSGSIGAESFKNLTNVTFQQQALRDRQRQLEKTRSEFDKKFIPLDHDVAIYRILDQQQPAYLIVNNTNPTLALGMDMQRTPDRESTRRYALRDALAVFDAEWKVIDFEQETPKLTFIAGQNVVTAANTVFMLPANRNQPVFVRFSSEFYRLKGDDYTRNLDQAEVVGTSNMELTLPEPLSSNGFQVSDIMLIDPSTTTADERNPYRILPSYSIPGMGYLGMYFEVYKVPLNAEGYREYSLSYTITEAKKSRRGNPVKVQITTNFQTDGENGSEMLEIDTKRLKAGEYRCDMVFVPSVGNRITRSFSFSVSK